MKNWGYFFAAAFFGSYLMVSNGVPFFPVLAGVAIAAVSMWLRMASARKTSHSSAGN
jgi:hypothetical protein